MQINNIRLSQVALILDVAVLSVVCPSQPSTENEIKHTKINDGLCLIITKAYKGIPLAYSVSYRLVLSFCQLTTGVDKHLL